MTPTLVDAETKLRLAASTRQAITLGVQDAKILSTLIAADRKRIEELMTPCKCDPLGSGEEHCNGGCYQAATIERLRGRLEPFTKLKCTAIASVSGEFRITFNTPMVKGTSIKDWNDKLEEARQALDRKEE